MNKEANAYEADCAQMVQHLLCTHAWLVALTNFLGEIWHAFGHSRETSTLRQLLRELLCVRCAINNRDKLVKETCNTTWASERGKELCLFCDCSQCQLSKTLTLLPLLFPVSSMFCNGPFFARNQLRVCRVFSNVMNVINNFAKYIAQITARQCLAPALPASPWD